MSNALHRFGRTATTAVALLLTAMTGMSVGLSDPAPLIERGFNTALATSESADAPAAAPVAGSEEFWLGQRYETADLAGGRIEPVAWTAPVATGETIVIGSGKTKRELEVVGVSEVEPEATRLDVSAGDSRRFVVTCRDRTAADDKLIRLEIVTEASQAARKPASSHAL
jgi:hypothetical protein